jgi:formylglycine-generating enzyme
MIALPGGSFMMGVPPDEEEGESVPAQFRGYAMPQHAVTVPAFALGKYAVTRGEFAAFVAETGHSTGNTCWVFARDEWDGQWKWLEKYGRGWRNPGFPQGDRDPVVGVNWDDANAYAAWLSGVTCKAYRLPSEAEWEYAARAGTTTARYWGRGIEPGNALYAAKQTAPVGKYPPNAFGLYDMLGSVWEWTQDCWNEGYEGAPTDGSAWLGGDCGRRILRGGSWNNHGRNLRAGFRDKSIPGGRSFNNGFRVARSL